MMLYMFKMSVSTPQYNDIPSITYHISHVIKRARNFKNDQPIHLSSIKF